MKIAVLYLSEGYECYHLASVSSQLEKTKGIDVTEYYISDTIPHYLNNIRSQSGQPMPPLEKLRFSSKDRLMSSFRNINTFRRRVLNRNSTLFETYDAIVSSEYVTGLLKKDGLLKPRLIWMSHGAGNRHVKREYLARQFDFLLLFGPRHERDFLARGLTTHHDSQVIGYPKFDTCAAMTNRTGPVFPDGRPFILYNPHYKRSLSSYHACTSALVRHINRQDRHNLVIAPHMDFFRQAGPWRKRAFHALRSERIHPDSGSTAMMDMSYTDHAAIYIGDISSQVYEFLRHPRPCIFLNPHGIDWQDDPAFAHWHAGEVVEDPADIGPAIMRAHERHPGFLPAQHRLMEETFGTMQRMGASRRAARAISDYGRMLCHD